MVRQVQANGQELAITVDLARDYRATISDAVFRSGGHIVGMRMKEMSLDRLKEQMKVTDDAEWKVIESAAGKVMDAQMEAMSGRFGGMGRRGGGGQADRGLVDAGQVLGAVSDRQERAGGDRRGAEAAEHVGAA